MTDERSEIFKKFVWFWVRAGLRRRFYSVLAWNSSILKKAVAEGPVIVFSNHASWWDAFVDHMLERLFGLNHYSLVDSRTLKTQRWLTKIGALGVDLQSPRGAVTGLRSAVEFLQEPPSGGRHPTLIIFPQGKIVPVCRKPLGFEGGLAWIKKNVPNARLIPLARRYEFLREDRPHIFLCFGEAMNELPAGLGVLEATQFFETKLSDTMDGLERILCAGDFSGAEVLLQGGVAINKKWEWVQRVLSGKTRDFKPSN